VSASVITFFFIIQIIAHLFLKFGDRTDQLNYSVLYLQQSSSKQPLSELKHKKAVVVVALEAILEK